MAKGSAGGPCVKCYLALALVAVVVLALTGVWNPFPGVWEWVNRSRPLSEPDVVWQQRVGGTPKSVTIAGDTVIVEHRTRVEALSLATGSKLWERKVDWSAVAGDAADPVVAVGKLLTKGYELLDPKTGAVRRKDTSAVGVWTYHNGLLDVGCTDAKECTLTAWEPRGTAPLWSAFLPGVRAGLFADNPDVPGTRRLTTEQVDPAAVGPERMPPLIGFPIDGKVHIVDTATGRVVQEVEPDHDDRLVVIGGRMLTVEATSADGTCYFDLSGRDPASGQQVWSRSGINLRTADGAGCVQREDPQGGQHVVVGVTPDAREAILDVYDGRVLWTGADDERLLAVDDRYALSRSPDKKAVSGYELAVDKARWSRPVHPDGGAALTRYAAVIVDREPGRIIALDPLTGRELVVLRSAAEVLAVGPAGMIIGDGRDIGYVAFTGAVGNPAPPGPAGPAPDDGDIGPTCGGPKQPSCG
ncbi:PQQ-binding-like beta-propeller repeat protein [Solwaraspora sp. WMMD1047]|uniref:outer membrane protein assembly factor BamB family protein n=1 Tax=Solwaraspora sp. WMMD1047 TaxID=3016102 RepID=UPI0024163474|nr:PQQ-binding-like beta-propeller repeat protein [Solwaraspora sp. WMMD1047]MDG4828113.1 PQQ-binding-like beta-propeller repeat protein [Solwaraspora sp. WMMD1047]